MTPLLADLLKLKLADLKARAADLPGFSDLSTSGGRVTKQRLAEFIIGDSVSDDHSDSDDDAPMEAVSNDAAKTAAQSSAVIEEAARDAEEEKEAKKREEKEAKKCLARAEKKQRDEEKRLALEAEAEESDSDYDDDFPTGEQLAAFTEASSSSSRAAVAETLAEPLHTVFVDDSGDEGGKRSEGKVVVVREGDRKQLQKKKKRKRKRGADIYDLMPGGCGAAEVGRGVSFDKAKRKKCLKRY